MTCNNDGTYGDLLVKYFGQSLRGIAFDWYVDLAYASIDSWGQMKNEVLNPFYNTCCTVNICELANTKQRDK